MSSVDGSGRQSLTRWTGDSQLLRQFSDNKDDGEVWETRSGAEDKGGLSQIISVS